MKICSSCNTECEESLFESNRNQCKKCRKEIIKARNAIYYQRNKDKINDYSKKYNYENSERIKDYRKEYCEKNVDLVANSYKLWYRENIIRVRNNQKLYQQKRRKRDAVFKLRSNISSLISHHLRHCGSSKYNQSCTNYLPYSFDELKNHLEKQFEGWMSWDNYGIYSSSSWKENDQSSWTWNIDHIIPQSKLPYTSMNDDNFKKCWALENLRPISSKSNLLKGNKAC